MLVFFFFQAEDGIRDYKVTGVQTCALPILGLAFAPRSPGALASVLTFRYDPRRGIAVQRDVKPPATRARLVTSSHDRIGTMTVDAVTAEWVETKTLSFVEAVLKADVPCHECFCAVLVCQRQSLF